MFFLPWFHFLWCKAWASLRFHRAERQAQCKSVAAAYVMLSYQVGTTFLLGDYILSHSSASQEESPAVTAREWEMNTELLLAQLILLFVLDTWWHSPPRIPEPASHLFALRTRPGSALLPAHTSGAALLTKQPSVLLLHCSKSHGSHPNLDNFFFVQIDIFCTGEIERKIFHPTAIEPVLPVLSPAGPYQSHMAAWICLHRAACKSSASICCALVINQSLPFTRR